MTPDAQQPREYIITMGRIIKARNMLMVDGYHNADVLDRVVNLLRSRPHTPAPQGIMEFNVANAYYAGLEDGKKEATRAATLAAYDIIDIEIQEIQSRIESSAMGSPLSERERGRIIGLLDVRVKLESLRQQAGEQE